MATVYKIHPAIGVARVGNSPDEFFVGPEKIGEVPSPPGGFKDNQCRIKRQAARFHIFAHHDDGTVEEITNAEADITWTVHLVNRKAAHPMRGNSESAADLTIDPGARSVSGPTQKQLFDTGQIKFSGGAATTVPLGEMRSDAESRLLVLGGAGTAASPTGTPLNGDFWASPKWYDDISDGPVEATVKIRADNSTHAVVGAWVIVAPPKFAPHQESVITLYDRMLHAMIAAGRVAAPTTTSYTKDVYPILQRARDTGWVEHVGGAHTWTDPVTGSGLRTAIFNRLKVPGGSDAGGMPEINDSYTKDDRLTATQYAHMERWKDGTYANDWAGPPAPQASITPDGLDRAALEACVGGAFFPGIEAGGRGETGYLRPIIDPANFAEAFRLNAGVLQPGAITAEMALPWQNDFFQCADNWWPVPRPNYVERNGSPGQSFVAGVASSAEQMVDNWHKLGFVVQQGAKHVEVDRCDVASINLLTPVLDFQQVPQGPMGMSRETALAITFEVSSPSTAVTLQYAAGAAPSHPQLTAFNASVTVGPTGASGTATARLWVIFRTANPGDVLPPQVVTIEQAGTSAKWDVTIVGETVARRTAAAALVLDRSGSMTEDRGDGQSKHTSAQQAANIFVDLMLEGDGVGVVRFNQDAELLQPVITVGNASLSDLNRANVRDLINGSGLDPSGETSIGDGIAIGHAALAAASGFDVKSLVVLTDGVENRARSIAEVAGDIDERTYAVGLGQPQNISVPALQSISGNSGGYLLVTGSIAGDNRFLLQKYFLQILAGISNAEVVLDPDGLVLPGRVERVPFRLTAADSGADVILLTPAPNAIDFRVETPSGQVIEPWQAASQPGMRFRLSQGLSYYRLALPFEHQLDRFDVGGTWHALLSIGQPRLERRPTDTPTVERSSARLATTALRGARAQRESILTAERFLAHTPAPAAMSVGVRGRSLPFSLVVHAYSNVTLRASAEQSGFEPGAVVSLRASVRESGIPLAVGVQAWAEVRRPDGSSQNVSLAVDADGDLGGSFVAATPGVHRVRVRAHGRTFRGEPFTREQTLTAAVWRGGDRTTVPGVQGQGGGRSDDLCDLLRCLLESGVVSPALEQRLRENGIDLERLRRCIAAFCSPAAGTTTAGTPATGPSNSGPSSSGRPCC